MLARAALQTPLIFDFSRVAIRPDSWFTQGDSLPGRIIALIGRNGSGKSTLPERIGARLSPAALGNIFKSVAKYIKMPPEEMRGISGHSIRVGATQDLLALNIDLASVMQAGRWKSHRMPMRYGEHALAGHGGMARAAKAQGRD